MEWPVNSGEILESVQRLFASGTWWVYKGDTVREFEGRFAAAHDCEFGVSLCNGTVGLDIVLRALGIGPGDKVILPAYDYYCLPKSVSNVGATPVFVDICRENLTIDADQVHAAVTDDVKAVVAVHLGGAVARVDVLREMCAAAGVHLIEDCAQAAGGRYRGKRVGSWGRAGVFSFGGVKLMTSGQGGMITTSDRELYEKCHALANRGRGPDGTPNAYELIGDNCQMSELSAAVLLPQLEILDGLCDRRRHIMDFLDRAIDAIDGLRPLKTFDGTDCRAQMQYCFHYDGGESGLDRDEFLRAARQLDIPLRPLHGCVTHDELLFNRYASSQEFPRAEAADGSVVSCFHWDLLRGQEYWKEAVARLAGILEGA